MRHSDPVSNGGGVSRKLALVAAVIALAVLPGGSYAQDADGGVITTGDPSADALIADIERVTAEMVELKGQLRLDRVDPDAVLDTTGHDPHDILEWVATETRWLPYEGALRGARGVLMDRSGNSLDRALLLADLLDRAGLDVRLANTTLAEATASSLASAALARPWAPDSGPWLASEEEAEAYRASIRSAARELASEVGLLDGPVADGREPDGVIAEHWWVQASSEGQWHDYDPLFAADTEARPPVERTLHPADLPDELRHTVTLRIVTERHEDGALIEEIPLEHTIPMGVDAPNDTIELDFDVWVPPELTDQASETADVIEGARMAASWRPRFWLGDLVVTGDWFSEAGRIETPGTPAQGGALSEGAGALAGLGSEPSEQEATEASLSAAWIEYETAGPGLEPRTERREILDLVGASRDDAGVIDAQALASDDADLRRGLAFQGGTDILLQAAAVHPDAFLDAYLDAWIELRPALIALVFLRAGVDDERIVPSLASPELHPIDLLAMTSARDRWATSPATFIGRPQVWSRHFFYDAGDEATGGSSAVDIVSNDIDVIPSEGTDGRLVRLEQGLLDTLLEHVLAPSPGGLNTWDRFEQRRDEGMDWTVLRPGADPAVGIAEALPAADLARIRAALAGGDSVVVAAEPRLRGDVAFADWWRISADGTAVGIGYRGWGSQVSERQAITQPSMKTLSLAKDAQRVERQLAGLRKAAEFGRATGQYRPYGHLEAKYGIVDPFAKTLPVIIAL